MHIVEFVQSQAKNVANGVITDAHVLGLTSKNGREYSHTALKEALTLYENAPIYVDHLPGQPRKAEDRFGTLSNVRLADDGIRGDIHFLTSHPLSVRVQEDLQRNMCLYGLSHDAEGKGVRRGRVTVIESISKVNSVDLVTCPATVHGLLEQQIKEATEEEVEEKEPKAAEAAEMDAQAAAEEELAPDQKLVMDILDALSGEGTPEEKRQKVMALLDAHLKLSLSLAVEKALETNEDKADEGEVTEQTLREQIEALTAEVAALKSTRPTKYLPPRSVPTGAALSEQAIPTDRKELGKWLRR